MLAGARPSPVRSATDFVQPGQAGAGEVATRPRMRYLDRMDRVPLAISYACRKHRTQLRKDGETPYVAHPMRVLLIVLREFGETDEDTLAAAVLHDTIEDTTADYDEVAEAFGEAVARYVALLTKDKRLPEREREDRFFEQLRTAPLPVKLCKIADTLDNLRDAAKATSREKTVAKARRLIEIYGAEPALAAALAILRKEVEAA